MQSHIVASTFILRCFDFYQLGIKWLSIKVNGYNFLFSVILARLYECAGKACAIIPASALAITATAKC